MRFLVTRIFLRQVNVFLCATGIFKTGSHYEYIGQRPVGHCILAGFIVISIFSYCDSVYKCAEINI